MLQYYTPSLTQYKRLLTREIAVGSLLLGGKQPIRVQTMTTTDTLDTKATVEQAIRCIEAGAELIRITAPSKKEAENLLEIKKKIRAAGFETPLVADIHFTPNAAELAAKLIEKVRINPGNYVDKKKFDFIEYTDSAYNAEKDRIRERFLPLIKICKAYGTAMRIGTNHGSLSDRIMSRYGDTPIGMVESALEFLRIARDENYHQIVLSMKSSNPLVMAEAYRLLVKKMDEEFNECYPLHLGVTEAGDGEDGRIKSAIGIGGLLEDGIGDTIRVSLTEDPEFEIPVCQDIIEKYTRFEITKESNTPSIDKLPYNPFAYQKRKSFALQNIGGGLVPVVIADMSKEANITPQTLERIGYSYNESLDKWVMQDLAADYIYTGKQLIDFSLPGMLRQIIDSDVYETLQETVKIYPLFHNVCQMNTTNTNSRLNFVVFDAYSKQNFIDNLDKINNKTVICVKSDNANAMQSMRRFFIELSLHKIQNPVIIWVQSECKTLETHLVKFSVDAGTILTDGFGEGICLTYTSQASLKNVKTSGRTYLPNNDINQFTNNTAFSILQATRTRISKTEYISCPSCGRTLFDLQETTAKIRKATSHLKGVKIAIMGCIVNGPGEMADADFGYVGSGVGKISLYKSKEVVKKNIPSETAVEELIQLLKDNNVWVEP